MAPPQQQFQYIKLPDGSYGKFAANATDEQIRAAVSKDFPNAFKPADTRNEFQREADDLTKIEPFNARPGVLGHIETAVGNMGGGVLSPLSLIAHPENTLKSLVNTASIQYGERPFPDVPSMQEGLVRTAMENPAGLAENVAGGLLGGEAAGGVLEAARPMLRPLGDLVQKPAAWNMTRLVDRNTMAAARDASAGVDPGRAMLESGIGPTLTKASLLRKIGDARGDVGSAIGDAVNRADHNALSPHPLSTDVAPAIEQPIASKIGEVSGPGRRVPAETARAPYDELQRSMTDTAPGATKPIYGAGAPDEILPSDLWKTIRNIDRNTRFNVDPEVETINETQRDIRGGLRPLLEATDPEIQPLSHQYAGLSSAEDAMERTAARPFLGFRAGVLHNILHNTPVNTFLSSGAFRLGDFLKNMSGTPEATGIPFTPRMTLKPLQLEADVPGNADYGEDHSPGFTPIPAPRVNVAPVPRSLFALPETASPSNYGPMIWQRMEVPTPVALPPTDAPLFPAGSEFRGTQETPFYPPGSRFNPRRSFSPDQDQQ